MRTIGMIMSGAGAVVCALAVVDATLRGAPQAATLPAMAFFPNALLFAYWHSR